MFTNLLEVLGDKFWFVIVGCIEILVGIILCLHLSKNKKMGGQRILVGNEKKFDEAMQKSSVACLLIKVSGKLPVFYMGNLEDVLMVDFQSIEKDITTLFSHGKDKEIVKNAWNVYQKWNGEKTLQYEMELLNGKFIHIDIVRTDDNAYDFFTISDITQEHKQIQQYQELLKKSEDESQSKTSFLSRMSHEIRTPMNGIIGMLSLSKQKLDKNNVIYPYLEKCTELSNHLLDLINDILDMSRIEAGKVELENKPFSIHKMGEKLYDMFKSQLQQKNVHFEVNYEDVTEDIVIGDELRITQVLMNFLSNAVKFTSQGEVVVTIKQMMSSNHQSDLMLKVHDTGIGMSTEFISKIFRPFEQESISTSKKYGGTGLGMAISDQIISLMGGEIVVESTKGVGSDFSVFVSLPTVDQDVMVENASTEQVIESSSKEHTFQNRRVLLAEDNEINVIVLQEMLQAAGAMVEVANDGIQAVDMFQNHPLNYYDCILMDVQMPNMDGRTAARKIRQLEREDAKDILIFALSADAFTEDVRLSIKSGMNGHFSKPIDFAYLQNEVCKQLDEREG